MEVINERCCGIDVHKRRATVCVITPEGRKVKSFATMTKGLLALADWLKEQKVTHVAMESTGVFWKPLYNLLEDEFVVLVANAQRIKTVPGRKTDVKDAEWIAELLRHGLVPASFIPERPQRELRELVRHRRSLINQRGQIVNRVQKVLEGANIKLSSVASNVVGVSGRAMLTAIVGGTDDPKALASLARGSLKKKQAELEEALEGLVSSHLRVMLDSYLRQLDFQDQEIARMDAEVDSRLTPFENVIENVDSIPGVGRRIAQEVLAEIGFDMSRFPTSAHLASWAKICPGNNESAGKRMSGRIGHGNTWLKSALVEAAWAASHTKNTYLANKYRRLATRKGSKRAVIAVAHTILVTIYHMIRDGTAYEETGHNYLDDRDRLNAVRRAAKRIEPLGYTVTISAA